jgi:predicted DNA binding protein
VFVELTVPLGTLGLVGDRRLPAGTSVEFERTASSPARGVHSIVVSGSDVAAVEAAFRESQVVEGTTFVGETESGSVYRVTWGDSPPGLIEDVREADGTVISAAADDAWTLELRFPDQGAAARFYTEYDDADHPITIRRSGRHAVARGVSDDALTPKQGEALGRALDAGYFDVPRRTTTNELADELSVSDTAGSERLRRGISILLQESTAVRENDGRTTPRDD